MPELTRTEQAWLMGLLVALAVGAVVWLAAWAAGIEDSHRITPEVWPQVTRTVDGSTTIVQPEDLDRP
jgi:hypothetical protein